MTPFFRAADRVEALAREAESWKGTPFRGNSSAKGVGVSCQKLAEALLRASGFDCPEAPDVPMALAMSTRETGGILEPWMEAHPDRFLLVHGEPEPGDLLGFRLWRTVHHLGVFLGGGLFVHVMEVSGVAIRPLADPTWGNRLSRVWRPIE